MGMKERHWLTSPFPSPSIWTPMTSAMPNFLRKLEYETPSDPNKTGFMEMSGGKKLWEMFAQHPGLVETFQANMEALTDMRFDWTQIYDTRELLRGFDFDKERKNTLFVDVGGGKGTDINRLLKKHPDIPAGCIILQEQPGVVAAVKAVGTVSDKVVCQSYDFFEEQPVMGECSLSILGKASMDCWEMPRLTWSLSRRSSCVLRPLGSSRLGRHRGTSYLEADQPSHEEGVLEVACL